MSVALFSLMACDTSLENDKLGVTLDQKGRVHILYLGCRDQRESVDSVEVVRVHDDLGGADDGVAWGAGSIKEDAVAKFIVGVEGDGYEEVIPLSESLQGSYTIVLSTTLDSSVAQGFEVERLRSGKIDTGLEMVSPAEFEHQAREACA